MKKMKKNKIDGLRYSRKKHKINMFDKLNKFKKYDSLVIKR